MNAKEWMQYGQDFVAANLVECCRENLEWHDTGELRSGKLREAAAIFAKVDQAHFLAIAQSETTRQAMQMVANQ
ncbi:hypothetical protein [Janthinobacterium sp.]|uniref:hypothetical protein n=1 Tax=Janthinobacterium sp. TaxID=1871054 RepID=UPI002618FBC4|nr:hypothetical protein [Janthinobacterium sp.]